MTSHVFHRLRPGLLGVLVALPATAGCGAAAPPCPRCPAEVPPPAQAPVATAPPPGAAPRLDGVWGGVLAGKLHLVLTVKRRGDGYEAVLDSVDQHAKLPVDRVSLEGGALRFTIDAVGGSYEGTLAGDTLAGTWTQQGTPQPLTFARASAAEVAAMADAASKAPKPAPLDAYVDVTIPQPPSPLRADGRAVLVYELHVTSFAPDVTLASVDVSAAGRPLAHLAGDDLLHAVARPGQRDLPAGERLHVGAGSLAVVHLWVPLAGEGAPAQLDHRIVVKQGDAELTVPDLRVAVRNRPPRVVSPPLKGGWWLAGNGPSNASVHRRALIPTGGHARIAQRFAVDWVKVGPDGKTTFTGDESKNSSYAAYGAEALAVADGVVTEVKDGIVENVPQKEPAVPITLDTVAGNHVVVDLGGGYYGMWAHLQPGSVRVKVGQRVRPGQVLGLVGNSGNSSEPHLHFHVTDGASPLGAEGVPYALSAFEVREGKNAGKHAKELPTEDEVVQFP
jgi:murein DD-endopeptidase MepM/ murein hydrolase activator NlpD